MSIFLQRKKILLSMLGETTPVTKLCRILMTFLTKNIPTPQKLLKNLKETKLE